MKRGGFREDLWFRIRGAVIRLPSLARAQRGPPGALRRAPRRRRADGASGRRPRSAAAPSSCSRASPGGATCASSAACSRTRVLWWSGAGPLGRAEILEAVASLNPSLGAEDQLARRAHARRLAAPRLEPGGGAPRARPRRAPRGARASRASVSRSAGGAGDEARRRGSSCAALLLAPQPGRAAGGRGVALAPRDRRDRLRPHVQLPVGAQRDAAHPPRRARARRCGASTSPTRAARAGAARCFASASPSTCAGARS